jgi:hypothetical protein
VQVGKAEDPRPVGFIAEHGHLVQVELEALDPAALQALYEDALSRYWDPAAYRRVMNRERRDRRQL